MLLETAPDDGEGHAAVEVMPLGFGRSSFRFASPVESGIEPIDQLAGKRIATAYPVLLQRYLEESGIKADVVKLDGAVETACRLGVADAVCDVVETGTTLRAAGLHIIGEPVLTSEAILVRREGAEEIPAVAQLRRRLQGVLVARQYVMLDYDCPNEILAAGHRDHARHRGPDGQPAADPRLVGGAGDGRARPRPTGSWTSSGSSAPAPSWSPASTPPASERLRCTRPAASRGSLRGAASAVRRASPAGPARPDRLCAAIRGDDGASGAASDAAGGGAGGISQAENDLVVRIDRGDGSPPESWTLTCVGTAERHPPRRRGRLRAPGGPGRPVRAAARRRRLHRAVRRAAVRAHRRPLGRRAGRPRAVPGRRLPHHPVGQPRAAAPGPVGVEVPA